MADPTYSLSHPAPVEQRVQAEPDAEWDLDITVPILRPLWKRTAPGVLRLSLWTPEPLVGLIGQVSDGVYGWQIETEDARIGDFLQGDERMAKTVVEQGLLRFARMKRWTHL